MRTLQQQQPQKQKQESKPPQHHKRHQKAAYTQQQRPGFDVDTTDNTIFPSQPYEFHRTPKKEEQKVKEEELHKDAASSVADSSQVTDTICDSESYLAIHEMTLNNSVSKYNNHNISNHNNSTRETISLNDSHEKQQAQVQQDVTAAATLPITDATQVVHEMHLALLYLLSNPEEFQRALAICQSSAQRSDQQAKTLQEWNNEYSTTHHNNNNDPLHNIDNESLLTEHTDWQHQQKSNKNHKNEDTDATNTDTGGTPLPFVVFANDAEVVLPQAHTASQLFGLERVTGIELEAAAGLPAISQLFLRWLAIMPAGDHINLIDPPGLTIMRIAGGRYRVTAAHRVVWTWMNEFVPLEQELIQQKHESSASNKPTTADATSKLTSPSPSPSPPPPSLGGEPIHQLQVGDLVTMTIVDVFETDSQGKLLSYCPTFDNRAVFKTHVTAETLRKSTTKALHLLGKARQSKLAHVVIRQTKRVANNLRLRVNQAVSTYSTSTTANSQQQNQNQNSQQQQQNYRSTPLPHTTHAVDLNLDDDDYYYQDDNQEDDTSKALMEFKAAVAAEENNNMRGGGGGAVYAASSTYMADDDLERHEV